MKRETYQKKLLESLGLDPSQFEAPKEKPEIKRSENGLPVGVTLDELETYRGAQAVGIFLIAPELFKSFICRNCGETFMVSRTLVAFCTYYCTQQALKKSGIDWYPELDDQYLKRVWDNNEPLRVPPPALKILLELAKEQDSQELESAS